MPIIVDRYGRERFVPDDVPYALADGERVRVPVFLTDHQHAEATMPVLDERAAAFAEMVAADASAWQRKPPAVATVSAHDAAASVPKAFDDPRAQAIFATWIEDRDAWKRRQPMPAAVVAAQDQTRAPVVSAVPATPAAPVADERTAAHAEMVAEMENAWRRKAAA